MTESPFRNIRASTRYRRAGAIPIQNSVHVVETVRPLHMTAESETRWQARTIAAVLRRVGKTLNHPLGCIPCEMPCEWRFTDSTLNITPSWRSGQSANGL